MKNKSKKKSDSKTIKVSQKQNDHSHNLACVSGGLISLFSLMVHNAEESTPRLDEFIRYEFALICTFLKNEMNFCGECIEEFVQDVQIKFHEDNESLDGELIANEMERLFSEEL